MTATAEAPAARPQTFTLGAASLAVLITAADTYVVVLALPDMMFGVGIGIDEIQRATPIVSAFLLGYVATLPLIGRLADLRGCRPVLIGCLLLFALGCLVTAAAADLNTLVAGRALQGVGGGGLVPATLALVAQTWPEERRGVPLGVVGAVQEAGATLGPLLGAAILAVSGWRAIFWANLAAAAVLALAMVKPARPRPSALAGGLLGAVAVGLLTLLLLAPDGLVSDLTVGRLWLPLAGLGIWTSPLAVATALLGLAALAVGLRATQVGAVLAEVDVAGSALLAGSLGCLVLAFSTADPQVAVVSDDAPLLLGLGAVLLGGFWYRQRTSPVALVPPGTLRRRPAWAALLVNLLVGAGLVAALVDVPVFARSTSQDDQLGAALVLVRLLVAMPVGALLGGWLIRRYAPAVVAAGGLLLGAVGLLGMTRWGETTLVGFGGTAELVAAGFGIGVAIAPVNAALLAATDAAAHGVASALAVVARMIGMLAGLSLLTAIGLRVFYREQARIGTVLDLCPLSPANCPAYEQATRAALLAELHTIFAGAAGCLALAAVCCFLLRRD